MFVMTKESHEKLSRPQVLQTVTVLTISFSLQKPHICHPPNILAFCGILNLSIISCCWLLGKEMFASAMAGSLEIPNRAMMPLLHNARDKVTNVALLDILVLCPLVIWGKTEIETFNTL